LEYWSIGGIELPNLRVSGVGCQVSGVREEKQKTET
jgi:hypothetical protein